jgi:nickel transport protein
MLRKSLRLLPLGAFSLGAAILCCCLLLTAKPALAHRVLVFAYAEGDTIHTESKFIPDTPVQQGKIEAIDKATGKVLLTGTTDNKGKFSFKIPQEAKAQKMDLLIVAVAAMGHRGEWLLKAGSYLPGVEKPVVVTAAVVATPAASTSSSPVAAGKAANLDQQALEAALNKSLERHLAPIREMLTELTIHRTSLTDIIGGIGYIAGIFGLWAFVMSKKQAKP